VRRHKNRSTCAAAEKGFDVELIIFFLRRMQGMMCFLTRSRDGTATATHMELTDPEAAGGVKRKWGFRVPHLRARDVSLAPGTFFTRGRATCIPAR
jgi:hypothetical protein